ncbi:MAG: Fis family transcriptional regulator [Neisseriales bacterium]|nr:MAG: Fis family transcriptional regulator [Neisseriales bacterium]
MIQDDNIAVIIREALEKYFRDLDGEQPNHIYSMLLKRVEKPLLEIVLSRAKGNQTCAATMLGINRNTLRKKLKSYNID